MPATHIIGSPCICQVTESGVTSPGSPASKPAAPPVRPGVTTASACLQSITPIPHPRSLRIVPSTLLCHSPELHVDHVAGEAVGGSLDRLAEGRVGVDVAGDLVNGEVPLLGQRQLG